MPTALTDCLTLESSHRCCRRLDFQHTDEDFSGRTVADGTLVKRLGTSLVKVDLQTRMIERAETSEDRLVLYQQLGITDLNELHKVQL